MPEIKSGGGCSAHGLYEICGHTTETCPDSARAVSEEKGAELKTEKNTEIDKLTKAMDWAESSMNNHPLVATSSIDTFIGVSLKKAEEAGVDFSQIPNFEQKLEELKNRAPVIEINENLRRAEDSREAHDISEAKSWFTEAQNKLRILEPRLSPQDTSAFMERLGTLADVWETQADANQDTEEGNQDAEDEEEITDDKLRS